MLNVCVPRVEFVRISANVIFTNDDVRKYVIGALQQKLPRAPLPFNPALIASHMLLTRILPKLTRTLTIFSCSSENLGCFAGRQKIYTDRHRSGGVAVGNHCSKGTYGFFSLNLKKGRLFALC